MSADSPCLPDKFSKRGKSMNQKDLNNLPQQLRAGIITPKGAINVICNFVAKNYPIYGLHKYDEDFRQDIILTLIEKGPKLLQMYNADYGDFFTFIYYYISTLINSRIKNRIMNKMKDNLAIEESIRSFDEKEYDYHRIDFKNFDIPKAPFARKTISPDELQQAIKTLSLKHQDKKVIILALKSSYYLTDSQIQKICKIYKIKPDYFYSMIQHCKDSIEKRTNKREKAQERRNFAYYHHKRYSRILQNLKEEEILENKYYVREQFEHKESKHRSNWNKLNKAFEQGHLYLRPTNKTVANLMGICERQVNYYINCAKKELSKNDITNTNER